LRSRRALTYQSEDAISDLESGDPQPFGLPPGWSMSLSYLEPTGYLSVNIDGNQEYVYDPAWRTAFLPKGATTPLLVATGLKQLNRADAKLQLYDGPVSVGGFPAEVVFAALDGKTRYLSGNGLLLLESDRFGNTIEYHYANDVIATSARLERIVDSWGNEVLFETCVAGFDAAGEPCVQDGTTITLPDGRQVGWREETLGGIERVTEIFDAEGKVTPLAWESGVCGGYTMLENVTSAAGGSTTVQYQCMAICADGSCNSTKSWPVAMFRFDCPDHTSGGSCPSGNNFLTTHFDIGGTPNSSQQGNYTGYPLYSPSPPPDPLWIPPPASGFPTTD
jgi:hypothetical protein